MDKLCIEIAGVIVNLYIDSEFEKIAKLLKKFKKIINNKDSELKVVIRKDTLRSVTVSTDYSVLKISGNDIDDLDNPFNLIGIFQAIFRFIGIHSIKHDILLLHGSAARLNDKTICFGDDGKNQGKTLSSIECALISNEYIGDEFCFLDTKTWNIFSYSFIPLHIRQQVRKHLNKIHGLELPKTNFIETDAGYFVEPDRLFQTIASSRLDAFVFLEFIDNSKSKIKKLTGEQKRKLILSCLITHILKLFYPTLDRMKFDSSTDSKSVNYNDSLLDDLAIKIKIDKIIEKVSTNIRAYKITVQEPCQVTSLIGGVLSNPKPSL